MKKLFSILLLVILFTMGCLSNNERSNDEQKKEKSNLKKRVSSNSFIKIHYKTNWNNVNIHYNVNGNGWTDTPGEIMVESEFGDDYFFKSVNADSLVFCFNNGNVWDNNNRNDYVIYEPGEYKIEYGNIFAIENKIKPPKDINLSYLNNEIQIKYINEPNIEGVNLYKSETKDGEYKFIGKSNTNLLVDKNIEKNKTYFYKLTSSVDSDESEYSKINSISTFDIKEIKIHYKNKWDNVFAHYNVNGNGWTTAPGIVMENSSLGNNYSYISLTGNSLKICFNNGSNWDNNSGNDYVLEKPGNFIIESGKITEIEEGLNPPKNITIEYKNNQVLINFQKDSNVKGVNIYKSIINDSDFIKIGNSTSNSFVDNDIKKENEYYYKLTSYNKDDESVYSAIYKISTKEKSFIKIHYKNSWDIVNAHYNVDNTNWTKVPGKIMQVSSIGEEYSFIEIEGNKVEVCFNNGSIWDNNNEKNYIITESGEYKILNGQVEKITNELPEWTIMIYQALDNNLADTGISKIEKIVENFKTSYSKINVVGFFDGHPDFTNEYKPFYYEVNKNGYKKTKELVEVNTGDNKTLNDFLEYSYKNYKAKKYVLLISNHGSGVRSSYHPNEMRKINSPKRAIGYDDSSNNDSLSEFELRESFKYFYELSGQKINIYAALACLEQMIEIAYEIKDYVEYYIASEEVAFSEVNIFGNIINELANDPKLESKEASIKIADSLHSSMSTVSVVDSLYLDEVVDNTKLFVEELKVLDTEIVSKARNNSRSVSRDYYKDFGSFAKTINSEISNELYESIKKAYFYNYSRGNFTTGTTIYFGSNIENAYNDHSFVKNSNWNEFLEILRFLPGGLSTIGGNDYISINWKYGNFERFLQGEYGYKVFRKGIMEKSYTEIGVTKDKKYLDYDIVKGEKYLYKIKSFTEDLESGFSEEVLGETIGYIKSFSSDDDDYIKDMIKLKNGDTLLLTRKMINRNYNIFVDRIDENGDIVWEKEFGTDGNDDVNSIIEDSEGNIVILGQTYSAFNGFENKGLNDAFVTKLDSNGEEIFTKQFGYSENESMFDIKEDKDGSYILVGYTNSKDIGSFQNNGESDIYLVKMNKDGKILNEVLIGDINYNYVVSLVINDFGYYILGFDYIEGQELNFILKKVDTNFEVEFTKIYGGNGRDKPERIINLRSGNLLMIGETSSTDLSEKLNGISNPYMIEIDQNGEVIVEKVFGGDKADNIVDVIQSDNGNIAAIGRSYSKNIGNGSLGNSSEVYILELNENYEILQENLFVGNKTDMGKKILYCNDDSIIIGCETNSYDISGIINKGQQDIFIMKY